MKTPEEKQRNAAYMRKWNAANKDRVNTQRRQRRTTSDNCLERERKWRTANRDKVLSYKKRDRESRPEDYKRWKLLWAERHRERLAARQKAFYAANKATINARLKQHRTLHPENRRASRRQHSASRRARRAGLPHEQIDRRAIYKRDNKRCGICGKHVPWKHFSLDHIVPIARGGPHLKSNVQTAHLSCNIRKGYRGPVQPRLEL